MQIARFLAGAALITAPLSIVSGQASSQPDSSGHNNAARWIGGTGAIGGAALFLAFANSGNGANHTSLAPSDHATTPSDNSASTPSNSTPPATVPPGALPPATTNTSASPSAGTPTDTTGAPTGPTGPTTETTESLFTNADATPPHNDAPSAPQFETPSTIPEPGSLALTATGIIGLVPLIRRRRH